MKLINDHAGIFVSDAGTVPLSICLGVLFGHKLLLSLVSDVFKHQFYGKLANGNKAMSIRTSLTSTYFLLRLWMCSYIAANVDLDQELKLESEIRSLQTRVKGL
jgi:hypothetical protein